MTSDHASPDTPAAASDLRLATFRLARRLRAQRAVAELSDGQYIVLATLRLHGPHTLGALADRENVTAPSMNRTVNALEANGWVSRADDEHDRRRVNVALTDAGLAVVEETMRRRDAWLEDALAALTPEERAVIAAATPILRKVADR